MRTLAMPFLVAAVTACDGHYLHDADHSNGEVLLNVMQTSDPNNLVTINWPAVSDLNPFSADPLTYEVWHNENLLGVSETNSFQLRLSDLEVKFGCISIRAVRGDLKSDYSSPTCFLVQS